MKKEVWEAIGLFQGMAYEELKAEQLIVLNLQGVYLRSLFVRYAYTSGIVLFFRSEYRIHLNGSGAAG
ncbi:hypothetical protein [Paenibacillus polymyxa]|uniref:hypothetical protein n=1 Tax=Paenibacillus polymyxa TaxID=1406 RepID=UPI00234A9F2E|nr:hypothetical protein [Paenibacillus polymyxa]WCM62989.1 hypothetical protein OYT09_08680 [Paenibacillus polymyxa]